MKNTNTTLRPTPARRGRFKNPRTFPRPGNPTQPRRQPRPYPANDILILCFYPGMEPDQPTAA